MRQRDGEVKTMAYRPPSNIQTQYLTDSVGVVLSGVAFSIPLTPENHRLLISTTDWLVMALSQEDLSIVQKQIIISPTVGNQAVSAPVSIPVPYGSNGQLWFVAYETPAIIPAPDAFVTVMVI